jgi:hypothetical protein
MYENVTKSNSIAFDRLRVLIPKLSHDRCIDGFLSLDKMGLEYFAAHSSISKELPKRNFWLAYIYRLTRISPSAS